LFKIVLTSLLIGVILIKICFTFHSLWKAVSVKMESLLENTRFLKAEFTYSFVFKEEKMKKFWLILLSLGLILAFSVSAFAVDVKVSGEFYAAGLYLNKASLNDTGSDPFYGNTSTAFYFQRLRVGTDFVVSPCLKLVTQFDAMERIWGGARSAPSTSYDPQSAGTRAEAENIAFRLMYIDYTSPVGQFKVGYMPDYTFGTVFGDRGSGVPAGQIQYFIQKGPFTGFLGYAKESDKSHSAVNPLTTATDNDFDSYRMAGIYNFRGGEAGALLLIERNASSKAGVYSSAPLPAGYDMGYIANVYVIDPYFKAQIGPVALQGEFQYWWGDARKWENQIFMSSIDHSNMSISALSVFIDATANLGQFYVGGSFAYLSGDNPDSTERVEGGVNTAGLDWNPCLIMFNTVDTAYWAGSVGGYDGSVIDSEMANAWFFQVRGGIKPLPQLDTMLSVSYAMADKKPYSYNGDSYGWEVDLTGTYKITNNLSYMLGIGYLFTGDYFKGTDGGRKVDDDYLVINKLTLTF